jgi:hypothetical protein
MGAVTKELNLPISYKAVTLRLRVRDVIVSMYEYRGPDSRTFDITIAFPLEINNVWSITPRTVEHVTVKSFLITLYTSLQLWHNVTSLGNT